MSVASCRPNYSFLSLASAVGSCRAISGTPPPNSPATRPPTPWATQEAKDHPLTEVKQENSSREQLGQRDQRL